jgi:hypothetical protein
MPMPTVWADEISGPINKKRLAAMKTAVKRDAIFFILKNYPGKLSKISEIQLINHSPRSIIIILKNKFSSVNILPY